MYREPTGEGIPKPVSSGPKPKKPIAKESEKGKKRRQEYETAKRQAKKKQLRICTGCLQKPASGVSHILSRADHEHYANPLNFADHCYTCNLIWGGQISNGRKLLKDYWPLMEVLKKLDWSKYRNNLETDYPNHPDLLLDYPEQK